MYCEKCGARKGLNWKNVSLAVMMTTSFLLIFGLFFSIITAATLGQWQYLWLWCGYALGVGLTAFLGYCCRREDDEKPPERGRSK